MMDNGFNGSEDSFVDRIRVASLQYFIRPVETFSQFHDQVEALVETASDYDCHLIVFPEYFTVQLLTLAPLKRPIHEQIRDLARQQNRFVEMMAALVIICIVYISCEINVKLSTSGARF